MAETDQLALYRLWRPQTFTEVVAQEQIVYPLRQSVINGNFSHALLFSGTRGTGKTSLAKIFAKAINCLNPDRGDPCNKCDICIAANDGSLMDISEIDAASHNSVDHMRRLTDEIVFTPLKARFKVYIIDEVHMLSVGAFNALLKTLEEPPSHAVFVMATTEPHRIPATIISRCQHFKFRRIPNDEIIERIRLIAKSIDLSVDESALEMIAMLSGGALRDAISLLDQTRQLKTTPITRDDVVTLAGLVPDHFLSETAEAILFKRPEVLLINIQELVMSGRDLTRFVTDLGAYFRNLLVAGVSTRPEQLIQLRGEDIERMTAIAQQTTTTVLTKLISGLSQLLVSMRLSPDLRTTLEIGLIDLLTRFGTETGSEKVLYPRSHQNQETSLPDPEVVSRKAELGKESDKKQAQEPKSDKGQARERAQGSKSDKDQAQERAQGSESDKDQAQEWAQEPESDKEHAQERVLGSESDNDQARERVQGSESDKNQATEKLGENDTKTIVGKGSQQNNNISVADDVSQQSDSVAVSVDNLRQSDRTSIANDELWQDYEADIPADKLRQSDEKIINEPRGEESLHKLEDDTAADGNEEDAVAQDDSSDGQSSDTMMTAKGEMQVLDVWRAILDDLQKERRMDIALCARPARVYMDGDTFAIHFDAHLRGQHSCLSQTDNARLIKQLLANRVGERVDLRIILDKEHDRLEGDSAEWSWLKQAREQALIEEIPSPRGD